MPELCVERALEPGQNDALSYLVGIGLGRALAVIGDQLGTRLVARPPRVRFVSLADDPNLGRDDADLSRLAVRATLNGSVVAHAISWMPREAVGYYTSRIREHGSLFGESQALHDVAAHELGSIVLSSIVEGMRPILPERGWFSHPELVSEASHWWQSIGQNAVGGFLAQVEIEDAQTSLDAEFCLLTGPRGLDLLLSAVERLLVDAS